MDAATGRLTNSAQNAAQTIMPDEQGHGAGSYLSIPSRAIHAGLVMLLAAGLPAYVTILPIFRDKLFHYYAISNAQFGLLFSAGAIPGMVATLIGGPFVDRWGPRRVMRICMPGMGVATGIVAAAWDWRILLLALVVQSLFAGPLGIGLWNYLVRLFPSQQRRILTVNLLVTAGVGMAIPLWAELLLALCDKYQAIHFSYVLRGPFTLVAVLFVLGSWVFRPSGVAAPQTAQLQRRWCWRDIAVPFSSVMLIMMLASHWVFDTAIGTWMPRFLSSKVFATMTIRPGFVITLSALVYLVSRGILALLPEDFGRRAFIIAPGLLGGTALILSLLSGNYTMTALGYPLAAFLWSVQDPVLTAAISKQTADKFGAAMALTSLVAAPMNFVTLNLVGRLTDRLGEEHMWIAMLIPAFGFLCIGMCGILWTLIWGRHQLPPRKDIAT